MTMKRSTWILAAVLAVVVLIAAAGWLLMPHIGRWRVETERTEAAAGPDASARTAWQQESAAAMAAGTKPSLAQIVARVRARRGPWEVAMPDYIGTQAPPFTARDLEGREVRLSDYMGKDVLLIFWATWCGPCREEIPGLIQLRKKIPPDRLALIAVSTDEIPRSTDPIIDRSVRERFISQLKRFVSDAGINYAVVTLPSETARPYSLVNVLPSAFFIDPNGRFKMITRGLVPIRDTEAILAAEQ
jgi:thiol-disulfide isomerase/thioredoxin